MSARLQLSIARASVFSLGIFHAFVGLSMMLKPYWFFETIGNFPPFNRHYLGDFGAYQLPIGIALLLASRKPFQHRLLVGAVIVANLLHAFNHMYDDLLVGVSLSGQTVLLFAIGVAYIVVLFLNDRDAMLR